MKEAAVYTSNRRYDCVQIVDSLFGINASISASTGGNSRLPITWHVMVPAAQYEKVLAIIWRKGIVTELRWYRQSPDVTLIAHIKQRDCMLDAFRDLANVVCCACHDQVGLESTRAETRRCEYCAPMRAAIDKIRRVS